MIPQIERFLNRHPIEKPVEQDDPLTALLKRVNQCLEPNLEQSTPRILEPRKLIPRLRTLSCNELDDATKAVLAKRKIAFPFKRIVVFSSHSKYLLEGPFDFIYDTQRGQFILSLEKVLKDSQRTRVICQHLEKFNEQSAQTSLFVEEDTHTSTPTHNIRLGADPMNEQENVLFVMARYQEGLPQISLSVLNLNCNWQMLFNNNGKLMEAEGFPAAKPTQSPALIAKISDILREQGLIKNANAQILPEGITLAEADYAPDASLIPIYIVADPTEINPDTIMSVSGGDGESSIRHDLHIDFNGIFRRCYKPAVTVALPQTDNMAILLALNPRVFMSTPDGGFYRKEKGIIAVPFELPPNDQNSQTSPL